MKTSNQFFTVMSILLLLFNTTTIFAQEEQKRPEYITVTTMYWNKNYEATPEEWKATEKEYMEKVTSKNEHVMSASYFTHLLTENSNEVGYVQAYSNWESIDKAAARNTELEKEAWPDEEERKAFLKKLNSAYSTFHSDEIYATLPGAKLMKEEQTKDMVLYLRKNKLAFPKDGTRKEFNELYKKVLENAIYKNEYIKAYYPSMHVWGSDKRDFIEAFIIDSLSDLKNMFDRSKELMKEALTEEEGKILDKYFKSHGDYVYTSIKL